MTNEEFKSALVEDVELAKLISIEEFEIVVKRVESYLEDVYVVGDVYVNV